MNKVILLGRLTADPELRYTTGTNIPVCRFRLAVDRPYTKQGEEKKTDFISCVAFGRLAENLEKYIRKGRRIVIEGRIQVDSYDRDDRSKGYSTSVIVERFHFADSKPGEQAQEVSQPEPEMDGFEPLDSDDDLPF
jgi:single-strand DNA-binding protein